MPDHDFVPRIVEPRLAKALEDAPVGFVLDLPARVTLDEIQRVPQGFTTLEAAVDRDRTPAGYLDRLLTGVGGPA